MVMIYTESDCSQSFNVQGEQVLFESFDVGDGRPSEGPEPAFSYINVVSLKEDDDVVYHEDWVEGGTNYDLTLPDDWSTHSKTGGIAGVSPQKCRSTHTWWSCCTVDAV
jgi:hypothetical protein